MDEVIYLNTFASPPTMNQISNQTLRMNIHFEVCRGGVVCENLPNSDVFLEISYSDILCAKLLLKVLHNKF